MACVLVLAALQLVPAPHALHIAPTRRGVTTQRASHRDVSMATRGNARADDATRRRLFQALAHNRQPAGAITDLQPLRNEHEFAQCIDAWGRSREWKRALETLADYSCWAEAEAGMAVATIDIVPYNVALKACATSARWREAVDTLASMRAREGLHPDVLSYNTAISACSRHGDGHWADASSLLEQMREDGLQPSTRTYNSCLASCARGGLYLEAQALLDELTPSPALGRGGGGRGKGRDEGPTEEAERERQQARQKAGLAVADEANFNAAITACARGGAWAEATALLDRMAAHGVAPTASSYLQAMQALTSASPPRLAEGFALLQRLEEAGLATQKKSYATFRNLMEACRAADEPERAEQVHGSMERLGLTAVEPTATALLTDQERGARTSRHGYGRTSPELYATQCELRSQLIRRTSYKPVYRALPFGFTKSGKYSRRQWDAALLRHPEKKALAQLLRERSESLEIECNFKLCEDCHEFFKGASFLMGGRRSIRAHEPKLTHVFLNGVCSCGDAW